MRGEKRKSSKKIKQEVNIDWILGSQEPTPIAFFRLTHPTVRTRAFEKYMKCFNLALDRCEDDKLDRLRAVNNDEETLQRDWETWLKEKKAILACRTNHDTVLRIQQDFTSTMTNIVGCEDEGAVAEISVRESTRKRKHGDPSTPNKPVIRPEMKQLYPHISFMKKVKFTIEEEPPEDKNSIEFKNSEEKGNKNVDWRKWLENVLESSIEEIRVKILSPYTAKNEFEDTMIRYIGKVLMDFINKIIDVPGHVMSIDEIERDWIVNKISPLFTFLQATFTNKILFHWIEHDVEPTHERLVAENNSSNKGRMKADIVGVRLSDGRQVVFLEMSGAPTDFLNTHTMGDTYKTVQERIDSLNSILLNFLNFDVRYAKKIRSLTIQGIGDRLTLRTIFLRGKKDYADEEELSVVFPLSWEFRFQFLEVFELMENVIQYILEYPNVVKELMKHPAESSEFSIRQCISCVTNQI